MKKKIFYVLVSFLMLNSIYTQNEELVNKLQSIKDKYNALGMSVLVMKDKKISFSKGFGYKEYENKIEVDQKTKFRIASISKMITTTALMILFDQGKFKLDDDISKYLGFALRNPFFENNIITIRQILSHTSSLRDGDAYNTFLMDSYKSDNPPPIKSLVIEGTYYADNIWSKDESPDNHYFQYANINFAIAGTLIEKLSGKRFDLFCKENLFEPLGIDASFNVSLINDINDLSAIYRYNDNKWIAQVDNFQGIKPQERKLENYVIGENGILFAPQGGCRASAEDLAKFVSLFFNKGKILNNQFIKEETIKEMLKTVWFDNQNNGDNYSGLFTNYALGNHKTEKLINGEILIGHSGDAYGLISNMYFSIDKEYAIIFITNGGNWIDENKNGWYDIEEDIFNLLYNSLIK